jgi:hypothetical protein
MDEMNRLLEELGCEWRIEDIDFDNVLEDAPEVLPVVTVSG